MKTVKRIAALFALMLTTAAWADAPTPVALWNGDFDTPEINTANLTLSVGTGNTKAEGYIEIGASGTSTQGVVIEGMNNLGTVSVIYRYTNMTAPTGNTVLATVYGGSQPDDCGVWYNASGVSSGINRGSNYAAGTSSNTISFDTEAVNYLALTYKNSASGTTAYSNSSGSWKQVYAAGGLRYSADAVTKVTIAGPNTTTNYKSAYGMRITGIAVFNTMLTADEIAAYEFPEVVVDTEKQIDFTTFLTNQYQDTGWDITLDQLMDESTVITGTLAGNWVNAQGNESQGVNREKITDNGVDAVAFQMQVVQTGGDGTYLKAVRVVMKEENGTIRIKATNAGNIRNGEVGNNITNWNSTLAQASNQNGYGVSSVVVQYKVSGQALTTLELTPDGNISASEVNDEVNTEKHKNVKVTLKNGATLALNATLGLPTRIVCNGSITLTGEKTNLTNLDLSGVTGGVYRTWLTTGLGFNFASKRGGDVSGALGAESTWYNNNDGGTDSEGKDGTNVAMSPDGLTTITWTSKNVYDDGSPHGVSADASMVRGYLDDGNSDGVQINVKNVPFAEYYVIIYASTDQSGWKLSCKKVNGINYTFDESNVRIAKPGEDAWGFGQSSSSIDFGRNAICVTGLTSPTLTIESKRNNSNNTRGCISAIQIVPSVIPPTIAISSVSEEATVNYDGNKVSVLFQITENGNIDLASLYAVLSYSTPVAPVLERLALAEGDTVVEGRIEDNVATFDVSGLTPGHIYHATVTIGYTYNDEKKPLISKEVSLHQGALKYVDIDTWVNERPNTLNTTGTWSSGITSDGSQLLVDAAAGVVFKPTMLAEYVEKCDSEFTVQLSASEAVDADNDSEDVAGAQGGLRLVKGTSEATVMLQYLDAGVWKDTSCTVNVGGTCTVKVAFHYCKGDADTADCVTYQVVDGSTTSDTYTTGCANAEKKLIREVFVSDGTRLGYLLGSCQTESVVVDVEVVIDHDETKAIEAESLAAAQEIADKMVVAISDEVANVVSADTYRGYFKVVAKTGTDGKFHAVVEFTSATQTEIEEDIEDAMAKVVEGFNTGSTEINAKPGLYYGVKRGDTLDAMNTVETTMATGDKVTITIVKPEESKSHFYRIIVSPTPAKTMAE